MKKLPKEQQKPWIAAMNREYHGLNDLQTFQIIPKNNVPKETQLLTTTWVYSIKQTKDGPVYKARLCVRGDLEKDQKSLSAIFSIVARSENIRLILTISATNDWEIVICDVKNAFPNAKLGKPVYLSLPFGFKGDPNLLVLLCQKALYGLRISSAEWNKDLSRTLSKAGFQRTQSDWNLFFKKEKEKIVFMAFHVDDGIITSNDKNAVDNILKSLQDKYELKIERNPSSFLGIHMYRDRLKGLIRLDQGAYIKASAEKFNVLDMRPFATPMESGFVATWADNDVSLHPSVPYRSIIGALLHIARMSRPDVLFAFSLLSKYLHKPAQKHWNAAKRILRHLLYTL